VTYLGKRREKSRGTTGHVTQMFVLIVAFRKRENRWRTTTRGKKRGDGNYEKLLIRAIIFNTSWLHSNRAPRDSQNIDWPKVLIAVLFKCQVHYVHTIWYYCVVQCSCGTCRLGDLVSVWFKESRASGKKNRHLLLITRVFMHLNFNARIDDDNNSRRLLGKLAVWIRGKEILEERT